MKKESFIFDLGMNHGQDTEYYLWSGNKVLAIDADPNLIEKATKKYKNYIDEGKLTLINCAIDSNEVGFIDFYISEKDEWNSLKKEVAERKDSTKGVVKVQQMRLDTIIKQNGLPDYVKIDIEGYDIVALSTLEGLDIMPKFISCETECTGNEMITEAESLATLYQLKKLGYTKFKLVDQASLEVLSLKPYYGNKNFLNKAISKVLKTINKDIEIGHRKKMIDKFKYHFPATSSGVWGEDLDGEWMSFEDAEKALVMHRRDYFKLPSSVSYGFWCDWHAKY